MYQLSASQKRVFTDWGNTDIPVVCCLRILLILPSCLIQRKTCTAPVAWLDHTLSGRNSTLMQHTNSGGVIDTKFYWINVQVTERCKSNSKSILFSTGRIYPKMGKSCRQNQEQEKLGQAKNKVVYLGRDQTGKARNRQGCYWELSPKINVWKSGFEPQITWPKECWILGLDGLNTGGESHVC